MIASTFDVVRAALRADQTITPPERTRLLALLKNGNPPAPPARVDTGRRIGTRKEIAKILSRSTRYVDRLAQTGALHRVVMPGRKRACGFVMADVYRLIEGES